MLRMPTLGTLPTKTDRLMMVVGAGTATIQVPDSADHRTRMLTDPWYGAGPEPTQMKMSRSCPTVSIPRGGPWIPAALAMDLTADGQHGAGSLKDAHDDLAVGILAERGKSAGRTAMK